MSGSPDLGYHLERAEAEARAAARAEHDVAREAHLAMADNHDHRAKMLQHRTAVETEIQSA